MSNEKSKLELKEINLKNYLEIIKLEVNENQKKYVAPNDFSLAQAFFHEEAWFRGIYVNNKPVGFVMVEINHNKPEYGLWRFMINKMHQKKGYGKQALDKVIEYILSFPQANVFWCSVLPGEGSPLEFYKKYGFVETGKWEEDEMVIKLDLTIKQRRRTYRKETTS